MLTPEATVRTIRTASGKIHYHEAGEGHPLLLLHGSGPGASGWSNFSANIPVLAERFRVLAPDMPGWGASDAVAAEDRDHVETALHLLDALEITRAAFVGNSMGAGTAVTFATRHPARISHLVTMGGPAPGTALFAAGGGPSEGLKILLEAYRDPSPETMRELVDVMTYDPAFATDALARHRSDAARKRPDHLENFLAAGYGAGFRRATAEEVAGITTPSLICHGRDDRVMPFESSLRLLGLIPDARLVLLNRCGHWLQLEHAAEFNRLVAGFVTRETSTMERRDTDHG